MGAQLPGEIALICGFALVWLYGAPNKADNETPRKASPSKWAAQNIFSNLIEIALQRVAVETC